MSASVEILQDDQIIQDSSAVRRVNNLLNSSKTRIQGLELLNSLLSQCSEEDFLHFCIGWMQNCCKIDGLIKNRDFTIGKLLKISTKYQELKKSVSFFITTRYFDFFFKYLLNSPAGWSCTETILLFYRGACGPFQENLERHLKNELHKNLKISNVILNCIALIPCIGGSGSEGINYKKNWRNYFLKSLNVCQSLSNYLFADVKELQEYEIHEQFYYSKNERDVQYLVTQLYNHCSVLICMLLNQYPAPKSVPIDLILQFICRGLALNSKNIARQEAANIVSLQKVLPDIHCIILSLLKALIVTCKNQLLPYSRLMCKLIKQSLEWTESDSFYGYEKPLGHLRISAYETLCNWLVIARSGSCTEIISSVVSNAVNDLMLEKYVVFLKEEAEIQSQVKSNEKVIRRVDDPGYSQLCLAALKALQFLLKFEGVSLKLEEHKFLQEVVVKLLVQVQKSSTDDIVVPYSVSACRRELYSLLLELVYHPCPKWPPPTNFALRLFSTGVNDVSSEVSLFCSAALSFLAVIIHSQFDNGGFLSLETPKSRDPLVTELQCGKLEKFESEKEPGARDENFKKAQNISESDKTESNGRFILAARESDISSDEDSRNTVTFLKDNIEPCKKNPSVDEERAEAPYQMNLAENEPSAKRRRTSEGEFSLESCHSPFKASLETDLIKKTHESRHVSANNVSPESMNEEDQPKARYFLRSKSVGSSEEPEEASKRMSSPDSLKNTPAKNLVKSSLNIQSAKKKPRTKSATKTDTNSKTPEKNSLDEEDIKAAFDDSFVD